MTPQMKQVVDLDQGLLLHDHWPTGMRGRARRMTDNSQKLR